MTGRSNEQRHLLLEAYDAQLRDQAEMASATSYDRSGPLWRGKFGNRGFVTYRSLGGLAGPARNNLIAETTRHYRADPIITSVEWKTRGRDAPSDLSERLISQGFQPEEQETVMVGEAINLAQVIPLPAGVRLRRIDTVSEPRSDLIRVAEATGKAFGNVPGLEEFLEPFERNPSRVELWIAETADEVICVGRLEVAANSEFAGLWGGGTLPEWRGQGIYRALTAARAQSALNRGVRYLHSDCTAYSRPILEHSGLVPITTTTPYVWHH